VCVYIYIYVYMCIYICIYVYTYLHNIYLRRYFLGSVFLVELAPAVRGSCAKSKLPTISFTRYISSRWSRDLDRFLGTKTDFHVILSWRKRTKHRMRMEKNTRNSRNKLARHPNRCLKTQPRWGSGRFFSATLGSLHVISCFHVQIMPFS
jgi:hypothetical protein